MINDFLTFESRRKETDAEGRFAFAIGVRPQ